MTYSFMEPYRVVFVVKYPPAMQETPIRILGGEDQLEKG